MLGSHDNENITFKTILERIGRQEPVADSTYETAFQTLLLQAVDSQPLKGWDFAVSKLDAGKNDITDNTALMSENTLRTFFKLLVANITEIDKVRETNESTMMQAFEKCIKNYLSSNPARAAGIKPYENLDLPQKWIDTFNHARAQFILEHANSKFDNLTKPYEQRDPQGQLLLEEMLLFPGHIGIAKGSNQIEYKQLADDDIKSQFVDWYWPRLQNEVLENWAYNYKVKRKEPLQDFINEVYIKYYEKVIKLKSNNEFSLLPNEAATQVYVKEMLQGALNYLATGEFKSAATQAKIDLPCYSGHAPSMAYDFSEIMGPLTEHAKLGRPLPLTSLSINHRFSCNNFYGDLLAFVTAIADKPGDYATMQMLMVDPLVIAKDKDVNVEQVVNFLNDILKLALRDKNKLMMQVNLNTINTAVRGKLKAQIDSAPDASKKAALEAQLKQFEDKLAEVNLRIAQNRRSVNSLILEKGEAAIGLASGVSLPGGKVVDAQKPTDIRACKRILNLNDAMKNIGQEQEAEQEEEKAEEKEQQKGQEQAQASEHEEGVGTADENIFGMKQFVAFILAEFPDFAHRETELNYLWKNLTGMSLDSARNTHEKTSKLFAISKAAVRVIMQDPDSFKYGLVEHNLPLGFHIGNLNVQEDNGNEVLEARGIYYDLSKENEPTVLALKIHEPKPKHVHLKASASDFTLENKPGKVDFATGRIAKAFEKLTPDEIDAYNALLLSAGDEVAVLKMIFMTSSSKGAIKFAAWANGDMAGRLFDAEQHQQLAEIAVSYGGDAIFDLTDKLEAIQKGCAELKDKDVFDLFFDKLILKHGAPGLLRNEPLIDRLMRHSQFQALDKISQLKGPELKWFMHFSSAHAQWNSRVDLEDLVLSFEAFLKRYKEITNGAALPVDHLELLAKDCRNMKVGLDRVLYILETSKKHGYLDIQIDNLNYLDLSYSAVYQSMKEGGMQFALAVMSRTDQMTAFAGPANKRNAQSRSLHHFLDYTSGQITLEELTQAAKGALYENFSVTEQSDTPTLKALDEIVAALEAALDKRPSSYQNPEMVKSFLFLFIGNVLFQPLGKHHYRGPEQLIALAGSLDKYFANFKESNDLNNNLIRFLTAQKFHFRHGGTEVPTIDSFRSFLDAMTQRYTLGMAKPNTDEVYSQLHFNEYDLYGPLHIHRTRGAHSIASENLEHVMAQFIKILKRDDLGEKLGSQFVKLQRGLFHCVALMKDPGSDFRTNKASNFESFVDKLIKEYCQGSEAVYDNVQNALNIMRFVQADQLKEPGPTWDQVKNMIEQAAFNPQNGAQAVVAWIKQQPGFESLEFDLTTLKKEPVKAQTFDEAFLANREAICDGLATIGLHIKAGDCPTLAALIAQLQAANAEGNLAFKMAALPLLKRNLFAANQSAIAKIYDTHLKKMSIDDQATLKKLIEKNFEPNMDRVDKLADLQGTIDRLSSYYPLLNSVCGYIADVNSKYKSEFAAFYKEVSDLIESKVSLPHLDEILKVFDRHAASMGLYPTPVLAMLNQHLAKQNPIGDWQIFSQVLGSDILSHLNLSKELMALALTLSAHNQLQVNSLSGLVALADSSEPLYHGVMGILKANKATNVKFVCDAVEKLSGRDNTKLIQVLNHLHKENHCKASDALLSGLLKVDKVKQELVMSVLSRALVGSAESTPEKMTMAIEKLSSLSLVELTQLADLKLDAPYPEVHRLSQLTAPMNIQDLKNELQSQFFAAKNSPAELEKIYNDDRVVPVLNELSSLDAMIPTGLSLAEKENLLQDYAYIHAYGLEVFKDLSKEALLAMKDDLIAKMRNPKLNAEKKRLSTLQYVALVRETYYRATFNTDPNAKPPRGKFPFSTQIIGILHALNNPQMNINEFATGQGKSLIAALCSSIQWAQGRPAMICTSNLTLAAEGLEENHAFFDYMGISTAIIKADSPASTFKPNGINYTDVANATLFIAKTDIESPIDFTNLAVILDEIDFTALDEVTDFRYAVNLAQASATGDINLDEWLYQALNAFVDSDQFLGKAVTRESDVVNAILALEQALDLAKKNKTIKDPMLSYVIARITQFKIMGTEARKQLDTWLDSAFNAKILFEQGKDTAWTLEKYRHKDGNEYSVARIISHHRISKASKWSKGVHQFLHARINDKLVAQQGLPKCRIDVEKSHVAALSSKNFIDYVVRKGGQVWGMTGTTGSALERAELKQKYRFALTKIPTHQVKKSVILPPVFAGDHQGHIHAVYGQYKKHGITRQRMPCLIVEEDATHAENLKVGMLKKLAKEARKQADPPMLQFYNGLEYQIFKYDPATKKYEEQPKQVKADQSTEALEGDVKNQAGIENTITITTPLMGRGTDFKPVLKDGKTQHPHGLFVIGAYAEASEREEWQIIGREGRQGQFGLYMNIINKKRFIAQLEEAGIKVPASVRYFYPQRLAKELGRYKQTKNLALAQERLFKQTFGDIRGHFYQKTIAMLDMANINKPKFAGFIALLKDKPDSEAALSKELRQFILERWSHYMVELDRKYIELKDRYPSQYDKIFDDLSQFAMMQWNDAIIGDIYNKYSLEANEPAAKEFFRDFVQDNPEQLAEIKRRGMLQPIKTDAAPAKSEMLSVHIINYAKAFWFNELDKLKALPSAQSANVMAHITAIDLANQLQQLNTLISKDRALSLREVALHRVLGLDTSSTAAIQAKIRENPTDACAKIARAYYQLQLQASKMSEGLKSYQQYEQLQKSTTDLIAGNKGALNVMLGNQHEGFAVFDRNLNVNKQSGIADARYSLYQAALKRNPQRALAYQLESDGVGLSKYQFSDVKSDLKTQIYRYRDDKSKLFRRDALASELDDALAQANDVESMVKVLLQFKSRVAQADQASLKSPFNKGKHQAGRFQTMLNQGIARLIIHADNQQDLQVIWKQMMQTTTLGYESVTQKKTMSDLSDLLKQKMAKVSAERPEVRKRTIQASDNFSQVATQLFEPHVVLDLLKQASHQKAGKSKRQKLMLSDNIAHLSHAKLAKIIDNIVQKLNQDVQLTDAQRFELMVGFLHETKSQTKLKAREAEIIQSLMDAMKMVTLADPESCKKALDDYRKPFGPQAGSEPPKIST